MTYEEARNLIDEMRAEIKAKHMCRSMDGKCSAEEVTEYRCRFAALSMAVDVLNKQIPQPVGKRELRKHELGTPYYCPECEADITHVEFFRPDGSEPEEKVSYCWACGQAIRWE